MNDTSQIRIFWGFTVKCKNMQLPGSCEESLCDVKTCSVTLCEVTTCSVICIHVYTFRSHYAFLQDVLQSVIVAAGLRHFGMTATSEKSTRNQPSPLLEHASKHRQKAWMLHEAGIILKAIIIDLNKVWQCCCLMKKYLFQSVHY